jgi:uracil phosphoribosyltransferase
MKLATGFNSLTIVDHPLIEDKLTQMRDKTTPHYDFKSLLNQISHLMAFAVTSELPLKPKVIETPLCEMHAKVLSNKPPVLVNILRAGLGMMQGLETILPHSPIGHIGVARDHITHEPHEYKVSLPKLENQDIILIDPMLATGHSAIHAVKVLLANGADATRIKFMCLVAAPEGVRAFENAFPNIKIYTAALDSHLDENKYIVPGLGDAGDRYFGT